MIRSLSILSVVALVLSGCGNNYSLPRVDEKQLADHLQDKPEELHPLFARVVAEGERNHVLNRLRAGLAAMDAGRDDLAARTFDEALLTIETIYGGDEKAAKARGLFSAEDRKVFRGEPYERAMAYYYRGILYLKEGDYENARASFKSGILQDTLAEQEQYRQDFALLEYLEGWASQCNGDADLAREAYEIARSHDDRLMIPSPRDNLLVLAELGYAPVKYTVGGHGELLKIRGSSRKGPDSARVVRGGRSESLPNRESVLRQAMTRGGREFDSILAGKANFKESAADAARAGQTVATGAAGVAVGSALAGDHDIATAAGGIAAAAGLFSMISGSVSHATEAAADTRHWDNLPEAVAYGTFYNTVSEVKGGAPVSLKVAFSEGEKGVRRMWYGGNETCELVWARSQPGSEVSSLWNRIAGKTFSGDFHWDDGTIFENKKIKFSSTGQFSPVFRPRLTSELEYPTISNSWQISDSKIVFTYQAEHAFFSNWMMESYVGNLQGKVMRVRGIYKDNRGGLLGGLPRSFNFTAQLHEVPE